MHFLTFVVTKNGPDDYGYQKELEDALEPFYEGNCQPNEVYSKEEVDEIITDYQKNHPDEELDDDRKLAILEEESGEILPYFEDDGSVCAYYNKNAKWDWYEKGGRWAYYLTTKSGEVTNCCKLKDLDFDSEAANYKEAALNWDIIMGNIKCPKDKQHLKSLNPNYYKNKFKNKETYAEIQAMIYSEAILMIDGKWIEDDDKIDTCNWPYKCNKILRSIDPELYVTIIDCHI